MWKLPLAYYFHLLPYQAEFSLNNLVLVAPSPILLKLHFIMRHTTLSSYAPTLQYNTSSANVLHFPKVGKHLHFETPASWGRQVPWSKYPLSNITCLTASIINCYLKIWALWICLKFTGFLSWHTCTTAFCTLQYNAIPTDHGTTCYGFCPKRNCTVYLGLNTTWRGSSRA